MQLVRQVPAIMFLTLLAASAAHGQDKKPLIKARGNQLDFTIGDELVTSYRIGELAKPIFWPVNAPGGVSLTRAWPNEKAAKGESTDHPHQKSAWFCHGDVIAEGMEAKGHGRIACVKVEDPIHKDTHAKVVTHNEWRHITNKIRSVDGVDFWSEPDGPKIMDEKRTLTLYDLGKARLIVLDIDLVASVAPITFGDTKEGALGIRIHDKITHQKGGKGRIENAEGKVGELECWGRISDWCDYSGPLEGKTVGLAILADPKNPFPTCWHVRGYGLMAANPFGRSKALFPAQIGKTDLVRLAKGEHLRLRYGLLMHEGDAASGEVAQHFGRFVDLRNKD